MHIDRSERQYHVLGEVFGATAHPGACPEREECERALAAAGVPLPLPHRSIWTSLGAGADSLFIAVRDGSGRYVLGFAGQMTSSRALPGHAILRVERFGGSAGPAACRAGVLALADAVRSHGRILRLHLEVLSRDPQLREAIGQACAAAGYRRARSMRSYAETIAIDLTRDVEEIFASLHPTGRRHIRAVEKNPVEIREIRDVSFHARMNELLRETMGRTGGPYRSHEWQRQIRFSSKRPEAARVVGLFEREGSGAEALLAFAVGHHHGDHVEYVTAASTRKTQLKIPLAYGLAWDLVCWGKRLGATWFDFGGITRSGRESADPLGGISDFKRLFAREMVEVGQEWVLEPSRFRAVLAQAVSSTAGKIRLTARPRAHGFGAW